MIDHPPCRRQYGGESSAQLQGTAISAVRYPSLEGLAHPSEEAEASAPQIPDRERNIILINATSYEVIPDNELEGFCPRDFN
jgi:hypothetical protein